MHRSVRTHRPSVYQYENRLEDFDSSIADFQVARQLADEIYAINDNANASAYELDQMAVKVQVLNDLNIDGLHLEIDETTQKLKKVKPLLTS